MSSVTLLKKSWDELSETEKKIAEYVLFKPEFVINSTIQELATVLDISVGSISAFVKKRCGSTFQALKIELAATANTIYAPQINNVLSWAASLSDLPTNIIDSITNICNDVANMNALEVFQTASKLISTANKVFFFGCGSSGIVIMDFQQKLTRLGKTCVFSLDPNFGLLNSGLVTASDIIVAISFSGRTKEVLLSVEEAKKSGAKCITITKNASTPLALLSDVNIIVPSDEYTQARVAPIFSRYGQLFIVDMLFLSIAEECSLSVERYMYQSQLLDKLKQPG